MNHKYRVSNNKRFLLIIKGFSQIKFMNELLQDLVITVYYNDRSEPNGIAHDFHHFIACAKNDFNFVCTVWNESFNEILTTHRPHEIALWSDGCPKHFKTTRHILMWWKFFSKPKVSISYNFFASYHGHNSCDGATAQAKKAIIHYEKNFHTLLKSVEDI